jgi:hypothetical protein
VWLGYKSHGLKAWESWIFLLSTHHKDGENIYFFSFFLSFFWFLRNACILACFPIPFWTERHPCADVLLNGCLNCGLARASIVFFVKKDDLYCRLGFPLQNGHDYRSSPNLTLRPDRPGEKRKKRKENLLNRIFCVKEVKIQRGFV